MTTPATLPDTPNASSSNFLSNMFTSISHATGINKMIHDITQIWTKVGTGASTPNYGTLLAGTNAAASAHIDQRALVNLVRNGDCSVDQGVGPYTSTGSRNNDGSYTLDRMILLSDGNNIVSVAQDTTAANLPFGARAAVKLTVVTANKKFGLFFLLTAAEAKTIVGRTASLQFSAKTTTSKVVNVVRAAILSWTGTSDAPTKDCISAWNAGGAEPTYATSWTREGGAALTYNIGAVPGFWFDNALRDIDIDTASTKQVGVLLICDDADAAVGDELWISNVSLVYGEHERPIQYLPQGQELQHAKVYYQHTWTTGLQPGSASVTGWLRYLVSDNNNSKNVEFASSFPVEMWTTPTVTAYDALGNSGKIAHYFANGTGTNNLDGTVSASPKKIAVVAAGSIAGLAYNYIADARLGV